MSVSNICDGAEDRSFLTAVRDTEDVVPCDPRQVTGDSYVADHLLKHQVSQKAQLSIAISSVFAGGGIRFSLSVKETEEEKRGASGDLERVRYGLRRVDLIDAI